MVQRLAWRLPGPASPQARYLNVPSDFSRLEVDLFQTVFFSGTALQHSTGRDCAVKRSDRLKASNAHLNAGQTVHLHDPDPASPVPADGY